MTTRDLALDAASTYRLSRLITTDTFPPIKALREGFEQRHTKTTHTEHGHEEEPDSWAELVSCPWCTSAWVALGVLLARRLFPRSWDVVARALAFSAFAGVVSVLAED